MIKSEGYTGKRWKLSSLPEPGDRGIQDVHKYRPWVHRREVAISCAFYHLVWSRYQEKTTKAGSWVPSLAVNLGRKAFKVCNNWDVTEKASRDERPIKKAQLGCCNLPASLSGHERVEKIQQTAKKPPGPEPVCILSEGHWQGNVPRALLWDTWEAALIRPSFWITSRMGLPHTGWWGQVPA